MAACDATYKLGIRFTGWSERPGFESYFHPFPGPVDLHTEPGFVQNCALARRGFDVPAHPDAWFLAARLAQEGKRPHPAANFPFPPCYGYHFDAYKLGAFLRDWAVAHGVTHLARTVREVVLAEDGDVAALALDGGDRLEGDIFVDCSGFRSIIMQQALGEPFVSYADALFNDRAVMVPTAAPASGSRPQTEAVALSAGWRFAIPLTTRTGNGYVYSSRFIGDDEAEAELRRAVGAGSQVPARMLHMKVGRVARSWHRNVLAAGLAQGFVEPLEATALHIVITTALDFARAYAGGEARNRDAFNAAIAARYDGIRDYIVAHYRLSQRTDTAYWRACAANPNLSNALKGMMTAWFTHADIAVANRTLNGDAPDYPSMSWHCLFAGYGTFPPPEKMVALPGYIDAPDPDATARLLAACARNFVP